MLKKIYELQTRLLTVITRDHLTLSHVTSTEQAREETKDQTIALRISSPYAYVADNITLNTLFQVKQWVEYNMVTCKIVSNCHIILRFTLVKFNLHVYYGM